MKPSRHLLLLLGLSACCCLPYNRLNAQQHIQLVGALDYPTTLNDIWGYVDPEGREYALVGRRDGLSIVSLENPAVPEEVVFLSGDLSVWRDIKTWEHYAYVTCDQSGTEEGLWIVDLSPLPDTAYLVSEYRPEIGDFADTLNTCHNLYIDEFGIAYLAGCDPADGQTLMFDLQADPEEPPFIGFAEPFYAHDVYAINNRLYSSNIYEGGFSIVDVSDKNNPVQLAQQETPFTFCHNTWLSEDGKTLFTTDERRDAPVAAYDISDLSDIRLLDEFRPPATIGLGVIPHNVHVFQEFLVISYYTDGCIIVDASRPNNLVQVGKYDESELPISGFSGAWGAYPYLPSGLILISDIQDGLQVLQAEYQKACYLEGQVRDALSTVPVSNVEVEILSADDNLEKTNLSGRFYSGQVSPGSFQVRFSKVGYETQEVPIHLANGQVTELDILLQPLPEYSLSGKVRSALDGRPITDAVIVLENQWISYETTSDAEGSYAFPALFKYPDYQLKWGKWGYQSEALEPLELTANQSLDLELHPGYADNFDLDLGWTVSGPAEKGKWTRAVPIEARVLEGDITNPGADSPNDWGTYCFLTGNGAGEAYADELDGGATLLTSPLFDLRNFNHPQLQFEYWFVNLEQESRPANDSLAVFLSNGTDKVLIFKTKRSQFEWYPLQQIDLAGQVPFTENMQLEFVTGDLPESSNLVEAALDNLKIIERVPDEAYLLQADWARATAYPNPFTAILNIDYQLDIEAENYRYEILDALGRQVAKGTLPGPHGSMELNTVQFASGLYTIRFFAGAEVSEALKLIRI